MHVFPQSGRGGPAFPGMASHTAPLCDPTDRETAAYIHNPTPLHPSNDLDRTIQQANRDFERLEILRPSALSLCRSSAPLLQDFPPPLATGVEESGLPGTDQKPSLLSFTQFRICLQSEELHHAGFHHQHKRNKPTGVNIVFSYPQSAQSTVYARTTAEIAPPPDQSWPRSAPYFLQPDHLLLTGNARPLRDSHRLLEPWPGPLQLRSTAVAAFKAELVPLREQGEIRRPRTTGFVHLKEARGWNHSGGTGRGQLVCIQRPVANLQVG